MLFLRIVSSEGDYLQLKVGQWIERDEEIP